MMRPTRANNPNGYLLGSYRIATAPETPTGSHFVSHPAKEEGIGLVEVRDRMTMQFFVR